MSLLGCGLSAFVGRERELDAVIARLASARLVTLSGPGGSGKTRLALEAADRIAVMEKRRIEVVELAALRDPALLPAAIAAAFGLRAAGDAAALELVARHLGSAEVLLVLDNLEQLLPDASGPIAELLARCLGLRLLVTSRIPLRLNAEHLVRVEPLPVPVEDDPMEARLAVPSVALFVERAHASGIALGVDEADAATVGAICQRLEGLPLAIELAAARLRLLSPTGLLARLEHRLGILTGGPFDASDRQRTMRATIAWSVALLPPREAALFPRLGVFRGGFDIAAALGVAAPGLLDTEGELLDALGVLVDHNLLLAVTDADGDTRFAMLETIREYALEQLEASEPVCERHVAHYLALAEDASAGLEGPSRRVQARRLRKEAENLRGAVDWAESHAHPEASLRLTAALAFYWREHGDLREGRDRLERAIAIGGLDPTTPLAKALNGLARITMVLGDRHGGQVLARHAFEVASAVGNEREAARALLHQAIGATDEGRLDMAFSLLERSLARARAFADASLVSYCLLIMGKVAWYQGDHIRARCFYEESSIAGRRTGDAVRMSTPLMRLGRLHVLALGDTAGGLRLIDRSVQLLREADARDYLGVGLLEMGRARVRMGQLEQAREDIREGLRLVSYTGSPDDQIEALEAMADWLGTVGAGEAALRAWGAVERAREDLGSTFSRGERGCLQPLWERDRRRVGEPGATVAWEVGRSTGLADAVARTLKEMEWADATAKCPQIMAPRGATLTAREVEVLTLLGQGCSDGDIAARLLISKKTASVHVANLKGKLGTENRVATALAAVRLGIVPSSPGPVADPAPTVPHRTVAPTRPRSAKGSGR